MRRSFLPIVAFSLGVIPVPHAAAQVDEVLKGIRADAIMAHLGFLADDLLEGRGTGSRGFQIAANYVAAQFQAMGLEPAGDDGSYFQTVTMRRARVVPEGSSLSYRRGGIDQPQDYGVDFFPLPDVFDTRTEVTAPAVFVGYGVTAPELGYDDYDGIDAHGKIVVVLSDAPSSFPINPKAHYSSRRNKARIAVEHGAVGLVRIYGGSNWSGLSRAIERGLMEWVEAGGGGGGVRQDARFALQGQAIVSWESARTLFAHAPESLDEVRSAAEQGAPPALSLDVEVSLRVASRHEDLSSPNIIAKLAGADPTLRDEYVVYTVHVDAYGIAEPQNGDSIYNGASDQAAGTATMIEMARAFTELSQPPRRSVLFIGTTGEEAGHLGSDYFVNHPTVPLDAIVANINLDGAHTIFPVRDIIALGAQHSSLGVVVARAASAVGLGMTPEIWPELNWFIASDHYEFVKKGVPALYLINGFTSADPSIDGAEAVRKHLSTVNHSPRDDLSHIMYPENTVGFARVALLAGLEVANEPVRPTWNPGDFFGEMFGKERRGTTP